jgi:hypothetical protein
MWASHLMVAIEQASIQKKCGIKFQREAAAQGRLGLAPHRHQPLSVLPELFRPFGDGLCLADGFTVAKPNGLEAKNQYGPAYQLRRWRIDGGAFRAKSVPNALEIDPRSRH